ncbi:MAG TPA: type II secretion system protein [Verrucomicrobiae bacterium]|nr:type II secretion system protein [Verrucomicrobiae bacterium]
MRLRAQSIRPAESAFTMIEIAISLAVIGIALVAIIGVLPIGMNTQKDNREETIINQDATVLLETIRNGARGVNDLTNYVYAITNSWITYANHSPGAPQVNGYTYSSGSIASGYPGFAVPINNGTNIIGLLSTPEFTNPGNGGPSDSQAILNGNYISNHVVAYIRSLSGSAVEKPPQDNDILRSDSFSYKVFLQNTPVAIDTNNLSLYTTNLTANLHDLRLTFLWPLLPSGNTGAGRQTFRTLVAGQIIQATNNNSLYYFQPQTFTNIPAF